MLQIAAKCLLKSLEPFEQIEGENYSNLSSIELLGSGAYVT